MILATDEQSLTPPRPPPLHDTEVNADIFATYNLERVPANEPTQNVAAIMCWQSAPWSTVLEHEMPVALSNHTEFTVTSQNTDDIHESKKDQSQALNLRNDTSPADSLHSSSDVTFQIRRVK